MWQALPVGAGRKLPGSRPSSGPVRSPPLLYRSGITPASAPAAASQAPCGPSRSPPIPCPQCGSPAAARRGLATAPAQHQRKLPRQLSAEGLARAFAPRRATSGLVRLPPASVANGGEGRSLGDGYTPPNVRRLFNFTRVPLTRGAVSRNPAGRGTCSNLPFHAKLLHRPLFHVAAPRPSLKRRPRLPPPEPGRTCRSEAPLHFPQPAVTDDGLARPA